MTRPSALVGYTGFVGGNLLRQRPFDVLFNSKNIGSLPERPYSLVVCAGAPAEKWKANADPAADRASLARLSGALAAADAERVVLISTVDVYPAPREVDESSPIEEEHAQPYGRHRRELERFVTERFPTLVVRLPALFGTGLKKNVVFDLLHGNNVHLIHADAVFQYYPLDRLWDDIRVAMDAGLTLVNFATEPVSVADVAREAFGIEFDNRPAGTPARYDVRSRHAGHFGGRGPYLLSRDEIFARLRTFVRSVRDAS